MSNHAGGRGHSANDMRSNAMNPNNAAHQAAQSNHANQLNQTSDAYWSSRAQTPPVNGGPTAPAKDAPSNSETRTSEDKTKDE